jgi:hypothetical protein
MQQLRQTHTIYTRHGRKRVFYDRPDAILPEAIAYDPHRDCSTDTEYGAAEANAGIPHPTDNNWMRNWDAGWMERLPFYKQVRRQ